MISVAMATYNGEPYIVEQLESIRNQTCKVDEIIIVDDCSVDATVLVIQQYIRMHPECNMKLYVNETNLGYKKNFQKALSLCEGDVTFLCDQDDAWFENKVEILNGILNKHPDVAAVSSSFLQINGEGEIETENKKAYRRKIAEKELVCVPLQDLIFHNISQGCAMAIRKEVKDLYLKFFSEELPHDWMLNVVAAMQKKCYFLNSPLFYYRIHDKNTIGLSDGISLKKKNTLEVRANDAKHAIKVLNFIERVDALFYQENFWLEKTKTFAEKHVQYLERKNLMGILSQNLNTNYKKLKTLKGRMLDIFFVLNR